MAERPALYDLSYDQLADLLANWGEPHFRTQQVWQWLYRACVRDFDAMQNLPAALRARLAAATDLAVLTPLAERSSSNDQTRKVLFRLRDGNMIESVLMQYKERRTVCVSTQVGCAIGCVFCATGQDGLTRNLSSGEIVAQVIHFAAEAQGASKNDRTHTSGRPNPLVGQPISNVVLMGMGEPLANYDATWQAIETLTHPRGYNLGARRVTLSTVGVVPGIRRLSKERLPINLAVSLHAAEDALRDQLIPLSKRYPLAELMAAVKDYAMITNRRVTFEYALIDGINDSLDQARSLANLLGGLLCHVNLIPMNPTPGSKLHPSPRKQVNAFRDTLEAAGIPTTVRLRRGIDIEAGCGQLRRHQAAIAPHRHLHFD
jgi:23S rRNA (adenine2503-C2)-methyltransferase